MTPYVAFLVPAHLGGSGVLATVAAGLYVSWNGPLLIPAATRLQGIFFWDLVVYLLEGLVFLVTGLQMRTLLDRIDTARWVNLCSRLLTSWSIAARFIWVYPASYSAALARARRSRGATRAALAVAVSSCLLRRARRRFAGGRAGAAADHRDGHGVSRRDLILFVTFGLIVITLVGQGWCCRPSCAGSGWRGTPPRSSSASAKPVFARWAPPGAKPAARVRDRRPRHAGGFRHPAGAARRPLRTAAEKYPERIDAAVLAADLRMELIAAERVYIYQMLREVRITDEARRRIERELDLEEAGIACKKDGGAEPPL